MLKIFPFIPKEEELDALIAGCGPKTSTFLQLLKETAMRAGEAHRITWKEIDFETSTIRVTPEKGSNPRIFKLSQRLMGRLLELKAKTKADHIFSKHLRTQRRLFQKQRANLSKNSKTHASNKYTSTPSDTGKQQNSAIKQTVISIA